jgi:serpin B
MKILFYLTAVCSLGFSQPAQKEVSNFYTQANNKFAIELYKKINNGSNNCFSPYSISSCLSMLMLGANSSTYQEMQNALSMNFSKKTLAQSYAYHKKAMQSSLFSIANSIWVDQSNQILANYQNLLTKNFNSKVYKEDFRINPSIAVNKINKWIEKATNNKIKDLVDQSSINASTRMVLVNAIHFLGKWQLPFEASLTKKEIFYPQNQQPLTVDMMEQTENFSYLEKESFQAISMPFSSQNSQYACVVFLPKKESSIAHFQSILSAENLEEWLNNMRQTKVQLSLPKFSVRQRLDLEKVLISLGMREAFSPFADFSAINGQKDLYLSKVLHEAFFDLNENGVEAAAATAAIVWAKGAYTPIEMPVRFHANRPFIYMLVEKQTNTILFLGTYQTP